MASQDFVGPTLTSLNFPAIIDIRQDSVNVAFTVGATDTDSGVDIAFVSIDHIINERRYFVDTFLVRDSNDSFDDGISTINIPFDSAMSSGTYEIGRVTIVDKEGNTSHYNEIDLENLGLQRQFTVLSNTMPDTQAPQLTSLTLPHDIDITNGSVSSLFTVGAIDSGRGVNTVSIVLDRDLLDSDHHQTQVFYAFDSIDSFGDGISSVPVYFDHTVGAGTYRIGSIIVSDKEGNTATYSASDLAGMGLSTSFRVVDRNFPVPSIACNDFNGDGQSDILWRNDNGGVTSWRSTGSGFAPNYSRDFFNVPVDWHVAGIGDFNGDGRRDILWRNDDGGVTSWHSNGDSFVPNYVNDYSKPPTDWQVVGVGDFNGDGRDDILWRNDDGGLTSWHSNGDSFAPNYVNDYSKPPTDWQVAGVGDFDGDGRDDILWRNDDGGLTSWHSNGAGFTPNYVYDYSRPPTDWQVAGVGDFNGDGRDDILWRNENGGLTSWRSAGASFAPNYGNDYSKPPTEWQVAGVGDFNGDGRDDILWRNDDGGVTSWRSNGMGFTPNYNNDYSKPPAEWHIQAGGYQSPRVGALLFATAIPGS